MKTFTKTVETPRLVITFDECAGNPYMELFTLSRLIIKDGSKEDSRLLYSTSQESKNAGDHKQKVKQALEENGDKVVWIDYVTKYEHSGVIYSLGLQDTHWDKSHVGFVVVMEEDLMEYEETIGIVHKDNLPEIVAQELDKYNKWVNGEVYQYILYKENGEEEGTLSGLYSLKEVKDSLPLEWKDEHMEEYLQID